MRQAVQAREEDVATWKAATMAAKEALANCRHELEGQLSARTHELEEKQRELDEMRRELASVQEGRTRHAANVAVRVQGFRV
jgi:hypothetical protein